MTMGALPVDWWWPRLEWLRSSILPSPNWSSVELRCCQNCWTSLGKHSRFDPCLVRQHCGPGMVERMPQQLQSVRGQQSGLSLKKHSSIRVEACSHRSEPGRLCLQGQELKYHDLWWGGPPWLHEEPISIPPQPQASELAEGGQANAITASPVSWWEHKYKCYTKLLHATAYAFRFCHNLKAVIRKQTPLRDKVLSVAEVEQEESFLFKQSQARTFGAEVSRLTSTTPPPMAKNSVLRLVHPFLSKEGLLQVGGRLDKSSLSPLQKHPIILSSNTIMLCCPIVDLHFFLPTQVNQCM